MSAFIVSKAHVDALVCAAVFGSRGPRYPGDGRTFSYYWPPVEDTDGPAELQERYHRVTDLDANAVGEMLVTANVESVLHRYPDCVGHPERTPGPCDAYYVDAYRFPMATPARPALVILAALDCYEYQSCEHPGWRTSEARACCEALRRDMIHQLPGYDDAPWEIETEAEGVAV